VVFELKGFLSPEKKMRAELIKNDESVGDEVPDAHDRCIENNSDGKISESRKELGLMTPHKMPVNRHKVCIFIHQFSLSNVKACDLVTMPWSHTLPEVIYNQTCVLMFISSMQILHLHG
jgi:hypothetical protein